MSSCRFASVSKIIAASRHFAAHPRGRVRVDVGEFWTRGDFTVWFLRSLEGKILANDPRAAKPSWRRAQPDYQGNQGRDARVINDLARGVRHSGRNLLSCPELKRRFPKADNQPFVD